MLMEQAILQDTLRQRVSPHEYGRERTGDDFQRGIAIGHGTGLTYAVEAGVGPDAYPGTLGFSPIDVKRFDAGDMQCHAPSAMPMRAHALYPNVPGLLCLHAEVENLLGLAALIFLEDIRILQRRWVAHDGEALGSYAQARFVERQDHVN